MYQELYPEIAAKAKPAVKKGPTGVKAIEHASKKLNAAQVHENSSIAGMLVEAQKWVAKLESQLEEASRAVTTADMALKHAHPAAVKTDKKEQDASE